MSSRPPTIAIVTDSILPYHRGGKEVRLHEELGYRPRLEFEAIHHDQTLRPCGPPEAVQPAFLGALAGLGQSLESL
jgi:hypothetical protein